MFLLETYHRIPRILSKWPAIRIRIGEALSHGYDIDSAARQKQFAARNIGADKNNLGQNA